MGGLGLRCFLVSTIGRWRLVIEHHMLHRVNDQKLLEFDRQFWHLFATNLSSLRPTLHIFNYEDVKNQLIALLRKCLPAKAVEFFFFFWAPFFDGFFLYNPLFAIPSFCLSGGFILLICTFYVLEGSLERKRLIKSNARTFKALAHGCSDNTGGHTGRYYLIRRQSD